jgi:hypothetical protein
LVELQLLNNVDLAEEFSGGTTELSAVAVGELVELQLLNDVAFN